MTKRERILELADGTRTGLEIAAQVGCTSQYVYMVASREGVRMKNSGSTKAKPGRDRAIMIQHFRGDSIREIAPRFGITFQRVQQIIARNYDRASAQ